VSGEQGYRNSMRKSSDQRRFWLWRVSQLAACRWLLPPYSRHPTLVSLTTVISLKPSVLALSQVCSVSGLLASGFELPLLD